MTMSADPYLILLAAGQSRRFGTPKQLACVNGEPLLRRTAQTAVATGIPVIVVLGAHAHAVRPALDGLALDVTINPAWADGMGSSIACGMRRAQVHHAACSGALVCLADQPLIDTRALNRLLDAHRRTPERIICADHGAVLGPPCLFPRTLFPALGDLRGAQGARTVLRQYGAMVTTIAMPDAAWDIDTRDDLARIYGRVPR